MIKNFFKLKQLFFIFVLLSCQPVEKYNQVVFDNTLLPKINISAEQKIINKIYETSLEKPIIDHEVTNPPILRLNNWLNDNINVFGSENIFVVNIINASIIKLEIEKENKKKYEKNTEFFYEINFALEFILKDDNNSILSKTLVNSKRSTTSDKSISLNQKEQIIDILILESIRDITKKADDLIKIHMMNYII